MKINKEKTVECITKVTKNGHSKCLNINPDTLKEGDLDIGDVVKVWIEKKFSLRNLK